MCDIGKPIREIYVIPTMDAAIIEYLNGGPLPLAELGQFHKEQWSRLSQSDQRELEVAWREMNMCPDCGESKCGSGLMYFDPAEHDSCCPVKRGWKPAS